jgi:hypothetical protein
VVCRFDGEDVPGVGGDYVGGEEVDLVGAVGDSVGVEVAFVGVAAVEDGAFDLDADVNRIVFSSTSSPPIPGTSCPSKPPTTSPTSSSLRTARTPSTRNTKKPGTS